MRIGGVGRSVLPPPPSTARIAFDAATTGRRRELTATAPPIDYAVESGRKSMMGANRDTTLLLTAASSGDKIAAEDEPSN